MCLLSVAGVSGLHRSERSGWLAGWSSGSGWQRISQSCCVGRGGWDWWHWRGQSALSCATSATGAHSSRWLCRLTRCSVRFGRPGGILQRDAGVSRVLFECQLNLVPNDVQGSQECQTTLSRKPRSSLIAKSRPVVSPSLDDGTEARDGLILSPIRNLGRSERLHWKRSSSRAKPSKAEAAAQRINQIPRS